MISAILLCGGLSARFKSNKLLHKIDGLEIARLSYKALESVAEIEKIVVVKKKGENEIEKLLSASSKAVFVDGGNTRFMSALLGLRALNKDTETVVIHDGARPFVTAKIIEAAIMSAKKRGSGVAAIKVSDTLRCVDNGVLKDYISRDNAVRVQTPQAFDYSKILPAYERAYELYGEDAPFTDDSGVYTEYIGDAYLVDGEPKNVKITYPEDLPDYARTGVGYDIHRLVENRALMILGVNVPYALGEEAHSDGDAPIHALADAILSALGKKDIGHYFPVNDDKYLNASGESILKAVMEIAKQEDKSVVNASVAIILEKPQLAPYIDEMKANVAKYLNIPAEMVGITVTTNEKTGLIGDGLAIAAYANVLLR